ncbi:hypothetical protein [Paenibacillus sp. UNC451MF]|uniref:hypothetical protein n=1 Tax=Paenibacillus sp. UNC451MF TaxID=1449063 RepID=UPI00048CDA86|nr:hypothetical protein [Paenibacillus sp. UNC451MF]
MLQVILVLISLTLSSCSTSSEKVLQKQEPGIFYQSDLQVHESTTNAKISFGMSKEQVDKVFGESNDKNFLGIYSYDGFEVFYRDNKVVGLLLSSDKQTAKKFLTNRGIEIGSMYEDVKGKYGEGVIYENINNITYIFEEVNGKYVVRKSKNEVINPSTTFVISMNANNGVDKGITTIHIFDYKFAYESK